LRVISKAQELALTLDSERAIGRKIGLVPTMGALHLGHRSLIERAVSECDVVVVTVFVNPLQFGDASDLAAYPRDLGTDLVVSEEAGASIVFAPSIEEMYPSFPDPPCTTVHVAGLTDVLEGASRPGHFDGVATVVTKLFALAGRCRAYFGEKDFQQLAVVRRLAADLSLPVDVVGCPTIREPDGLALSSRNARLTPSERLASGVLHQAIEAGLDAVRAGERWPRIVNAAMAKILGGEPLVALDYAVAVDAETFETPHELAGNVRLLIAATVGEVRLIDNEGATAPGSQEPVLAGHGTNKTNKRES